MHMKKKNKMKNATIEATTTSNLIFEYLNNYC